MTISKRSILIFIEKHLELVEQEASFGNPAAQRLLSLYRNHEICKEDKYFWELLKEQTEKWAEGKETPWSTPISIKLPWKNTCVIGWW